MVIVLRRTVGIVLLALAVLSPTGCSSQEPAPIQEETWDLVILSDSTLTGVGMRYAEHIEAANDVDVRLHDAWRGGGSAIALLGGLDEGGWAAELVADAEVVVYFGNPMGAVAESQDWDCGEDGATFQVTRCDQDGFAPYREVLEQIPARIENLRDGQPTIVRATEFYAPFIERWREEGVYQACLDCYSQFMGAIRDAADNAGVPVARIWDEYNGPDHDENPVDKGFIGPDGMHPSEAGSQATADLLHELGYEPTFG